MKCIRFEQDGQWKVQRVSDDIAMRLVQDGKAEFAPKREWKDSGREYMEMKCIHFEVEVHNG